MMCPGCKKFNMICPDCGDLSLGELTAQVSSCLHNHNAAHKTQKHIGAVVTFVDYSTGEDVGSKAKICLKCQRKVISGMANGSNFVPRGES